MMNSNSSIGSKTYEHLESYYNGRFITQMFKSLEVRNDEYLFFPYSMTNVDGISGTQYKGKKDGKYIVFDQEKSFPDNELEEEYLDKLKKCDTNLLKATKILKAHIKLALREFEKVEWKKCDYPQKVKCTFEIEPCDVCFMSNYFLENKKEIHSMYRVSDIEEGI